MSLIREEKSHAINGVPGRMFALFVPPAPWISGVFANQSWQSEGRKIGGYGAGGIITVKIRFDDNCKNGKMSFAITADVITNASRRQGDIAAGGCLHDDIARVFPELAPLIKWHLVDTVAPMHYVANTIYHSRENGPTHAWIYYTGASDPLTIGETRERLISYAKAPEAQKAENQPGYRIQWDEKTVKVRNLAHARSSAAWPEATDAELTAPESELRAALEARLPALMASFKTDMLACGFEYTAPTRG